MGQAKPGKKEEIRDEDKGSAYEQATAHAVVEQADQLPNIGGRGLFGDGLLDGRARSLREGVPESAIARVPRIPEASLCART
jgi:hypothetical protein